MGFLHMWYLYVLLCADGTYYTGITKDTKRRLHEHNKTKRGAKYTRARRPVQLIYVEGFSLHGEALRAERKFKSLTNGMIHEKESKKFFILFNIE